MIVGTPRVSHDPHGSSEHGKEIKINRKSLSFFLFFFFATESVDVVPDQPITEGHLGGRETGGGRG